MITRFRGLWLAAPPGVFRPRSDAARLLDAVEPRIRGEVLDVCTGSGVLALSVASRAAGVTAIDASRLAVHAARLNSVLNRRRITVLQGDLLAPVAGRRFDVIISNPPYLPTPPDQPQTRAAKAWNAGEDGRAVLDDLCATAPAHLNEGGEVVIVQSSLSGVQRTRTLLETAGLRAIVLAEETGPLGPIATARLAHLHQRGLVCRDDPREQIVVIAGVKSGPAVPELHLGNRSLGVEPESGLSGSVAGVSGSGRPG